MKREFEGYFCKDRCAEESYGHTYYLCESEPVKHTIISRWDNFGEHDVFLVPQNDDDVVFAEDALFDDCEEGKRYRVTIEEIECQK